MKPKTALEQAKAALKAALAAVEAAIDECSVSFLRGDHTYQVFDSVHEAILWLNDVDLADLKEFEMMSHGEAVVHRGTGDQRVVKEFWDDCWKHLIEANK